MGVSDADLVYLTCTRCTEELPEGENIRDFGRLNVAVTEDAGLLVACERHRLIVTLIPNGQIDQALQDLRGFGCDQSHGGRKETVH
jgi:hypothetical protein